MNFLHLPKRTGKNRSYGITSVVDFGVPIGQLKNILDDYSEFIDIAKIGIGTAYISPKIREKIELYKEYGVKPYFGGTLFEKCYMQNKLHEYETVLIELGVDIIEISTGTITIPLEERLAIINQLKEQFTCIAEVGSKDASYNMTTSEWKHEIQLLLDAGCKYVITEGRDSGTSGIYEKNGQIKSDLILELIKDLDCKKLIFEAPSAKHQMYFINIIGTNVNLGNVKLQDVLVLEAERLGLRSETFFLEDSECK